MGVQWRAVWESFENQGRSKQSLGKGEWRGGKCGKHSRQKEMQIHIKELSGCLMSYAHCPHLTEEQTELWEVKMLARGPTVSGLEPELPPGHTLPFQEKGWQHC